MGPGDPASPARARTTPSARTPQKTSRPAPTHSLSSLSPLPKKVRGLYQDRPPLPFTPGAELAGTDIEAGPGCGAGPAVGAAVLAITPGGGFAEEAVVPAAACVAQADATKADVPARSVTAWVWVAAVTAKPAALTPATVRAEWRRAERRGVERGGGIEHAVG